MTTSTPLTGRTTPSTTDQEAGRPACADRRTRVTRSLAGYGIVAGPVYVVVSLAQAVQRDGFDLGRQPGASSPWATSAGSRWRTSSALVSWPSPSPSR